MKNNIISGSSHTINIQDTETQMLFFEREIAFLNQKLELKDKEIESRDRTIEIFKSMIQKMEVLEVEAQKSREMITDLYERKIQDLKKNIELLEGKYLKLLEYNI